MWIEADLVTFSYCCYNVVIITCMRRSRPWIETESKCRCKTFSLLLHCFKSAPRAADTEHEIVSYLCYLNNYLHIHEQCRPQISVSVSSVRPMTPCGAKNHQYQPFGRIHCCQTTRQIHPAHTKESDWMSSRKCTQYIHELHLLIKFHYTEVISLHFSD